MPSSESPFAASGPPARSMVSPSTSLPEAGPAGDGHSDAGENANEFPVGLLAGVVVALLAVTIMVLCIAKGIPMFIKWHQPTLDVMASTTRTHGPQPGNQAYDVEFGPESRCSTPRKCEHMFVKNVFQDMFLSRMHTSARTSQASTSEKKYHFFVSHKHQYRIQSNISEQTSIYIKDSLQVSGLKGFLDIDCTEHITEAILTRAVIASCTMVVVLNDDTMDERWCRVEWKVAKSHRVPTVCVVETERFEKLVLLRQIAKVSPHLLDCQWLDFTFQFRTRSMNSLSQWIKKELTLQDATVVPDPEPGLVATDESDTDYDESEQHMRGQTRLTWGPDSPLASVPVVHNVTLESIEVDVLPKSNKPTSKEELNTSPTSARSMSEDDAADFDKPRDTTAGKGYSAAPTGSTSSLTATGSRADPDMSVRKKRWRRTRSQRSPGFAKARRNTVMPAVLGIPYRPSTADRSLTRSTFSTHNAMHKSGDLVSLDHPDSLLHLDRVVLPSTRYVVHCGGHNHQMARE